MRKRNISPERLIEAIKEYCKGNPGSTVILEFLLYYLTRPEYQLRVREEIYLDSSLDLF